MIVLKDPDKCEWMHSSTLLGLTFRLQSGGGTVERRVADGGR